MSEGLEMAEISPHLKHSRISVSDNKHYVHRPNQDSDLLRFVIKNHRYTRLLWLMMTSIPLQVTDWPTPLCSHSFGLRRYSSAENFIILSTPASYVCNLLEVEESVMLCYMKQLQKYKCR